MYVAADHARIVERRTSARVLIHGGSSGIGYAVAEGALESNVAALIISSSSSSRVQDGVSRLQCAYPSKSGIITGYACNLGDAVNLEANVVTLLESATEGRTKLLDYIVHTAGDSLKLGLITDVTMEGVIQAGMMRYFSNVMLAKHLSNYMNPSAKSPFTVTTAVIAENPNKEWTVYARYYAALYGLCKGAALELAPVRVNMVDLGWVDTELWSSLSDEERAQTRQKIAESLPIKRVPKPEDAAEQYLASMRDANSTGTLYHSNGGELLVR